MDPKDLFVRSIKQVSGCIKHLTADKLTNPTPCTEWDLRKLINHMVYELLWVPDLLEGKTVQEVGDKYDGDVLGSDPEAAWNSAASKALEAVKEVDPGKVVHLSYTDKSAVDYILEIGGDIFIHTWDADQAMKCSLILDQQIAQVVYDGLLPRKQELTDSGLFGQALEVGLDASLQVKLLALTGRKA